MLNCKQTTGNSIIFVKNTQSIYIDIGLRHQFMIDSLI